MACGDKFHGAEHGGLADSADFGGRLNGRKNRLQGGDWIKKPPGILSLDLRVPRWTAIPERIGFDRAPVMKNPSMKDECNIFFTQPNYLQHIIFYLFICIFSTIDKGCGLISFRI
jgi:hypothetical protein